MVTRGNNPEPGKPEDPGALKVYGKGEKAVFDWNRV